MKDVLAKTLGLCQEGSPAKERFPATQPSKFKHVPPNMIMQKWVLHGTRYPQTKKRPELESLKKLYTKPPALRPTTLVLVLVQHSLLAPFNLRLRVKSQWVQICNCKSYMTVGERRSPSVTSLSAVVCLIRCSLAGRLLFCCPPRPATNQTHFMPRSIPLWLRPAACTTTHVISQMEAQENRNGWSRSL